MEVERLVDACGTQVEIVNVPFERLFYGLSGIGFPGKRNKNRVLADDFINYEGSENVFRFSGVARFRSLFSPRGGIVTVMFSMSAAEMWRGKRRIASAPSSNENLST